MMPHSPLSACHRILASGMALALLSCSPEGAPTEPAAEPELSKTGHGKYHAVFLPTLGGAWSQASEINQAGQIVGEAENSEGDVHAVMWRNGVVIDLGTLGGSFSVATDITPNGTRVAGYSLTSGGGDEHAFLWQNGVMKDLGTLGGRSSRASGINQAGVIVGSSQNAAGNDRPVMWRNGVITDLGTLGGESGWASGINSRGHIVGAAQTAAGAYHAVLWRNGVISDLGTLGGNFSSASGINDSDQIVGESLTRDGKPHAALWSRGRITDLGVLPGDQQSHAVDINRTGTVAGFSEESNMTGARSRVFLFEHGRLKNLGDLALTPNMASGLNDTGQVVGSSRHPERLFVRIATLWTEKKVK